MQEVNTGLHTSIKVQHCLKPAGLPLDWTEQCWLRASSSHHHLPSAAKVTWHKKPWQQHEVRNLILNTHRLQIIHIKHKFLPISAYPISNYHVFLAWTILTAVRHGEQLFTWNRWQLFLDSIAILLLVIKSSKTSRRNLRGKLKVFRWFPKSM